MAAGTPKDVTFAPKVALVVVIEVAVGVVHVGAALAVVVNEAVAEYPVPVVLVA